VQAMCTGRTLTEPGLAAVWMLKGSTCLTRTVRCCLTMRISLPGCVCKRHSIWHALFVKAIIEPAADSLVVERSTAGRRSQQTVCSCQGHFSLHSNYSS
jgi:hypothetical protein